MSHLTKTIYGYYGLFEDDVVLMERAIRIENLFSLIRDNKVSEFQSVVNQTPEALYAVNNLRQTALHIACQYDRREILSFLLEKLPKDINAQDRFINRRDFEGFTALMDCAEHNKTECAKMLMTHQPDLKIVGYDLKRNVAHLAAQKNRAEILRLVLSAKSSNGKQILNVDETCKDKECRGYTPAHFAASNYADASMRVLKEFGANLNASADGKTPLMLAFQSGSQAVATYLLEQPEIDLTSQDRSGHLAYHYARHFRAPRSTIKNLEKMTEEQFKIKYPRLVSKQKKQAQKAPAHTKE